MRTTIARLLLAAGLVLAASARAQDPAQLAKIPPRQRAAIQTAFMTEKLHLTPEEKPKVEAINEKYAEQMQPVLQGSMGMFERMRTVKKIEAAKDEELQAVLTPQQFQTYQGSKDELREGMKQRIESGGAPP
jgi:hypothetical protein